MKTCNGHRHLGSMRGEVVIEKAQRLFVGARRGSAPTAELTAILWPLVVCEGLSKIRNVTDSVCALRPRHVCCERKAASQRAHCA